MKTIEKVLTSNDVGETGSHQAGIAVPSHPGFLDFFPRLPEEPNPSLIIQFHAPDGEVWDFRYVYYNNSLYGGTRNERRLCRTGKFLKTWQAHAGDVLVLIRNAENGFTASIRKTSSEAEPECPETEESAGKEFRETPKYRIVCKNGTWTLLNGQDQEA